MNFKQVYKNKPSFYSIWKLSWPIILANLTIPIVTATDTAVMGQKEDPIRLNVCYSCPTSLKSLQTI